MRTFSILYTQARPISVIRVDLAIEPCELPSGHTCPCGIMTNYFVRKFPGYNELFRHSNEDYAEMPIISHGISLQSVI